MNATQQEKIIRKYLRLSAARELYTLEQAAFRLNISRNELRKELIEKGTLKVLFRNGRQFVTEQSIKEFIQLRAMRYKT